MCTWLTIVDVVSVIEMSRKREVHKFSCKSVPYKELLAQAHSLGRSLNAVNRNH